MEEVQDVPYHLVLAGQSIRSSEWPGRWSPRQCEEDSPHCRGTPSSAGIWRQGHPQEICPSVSSLHEKKWQHHYFDFIAHYVISPSAWMSSSTVVSSWTPTSVGGVCCNKTTQFFERKADTLTWPCFLKSYDFLPLTLFCPSSMSVYHHQPWRTDTCTSRTIAKKLDSGKYFS